MAGADLSLLAMGGILVFAVVVFLWISYEDRHRDPPATKHLH